MSDHAPLSFVDACLSGDALLDEIDDWVEEWHTTDVPAIASMSLDEFLGFTEEEGDLWAEKPETLRFIVVAHSRNRTVQQVMAGQDEWARAARSVSPEDADAVVAWLRETDRI